MHLDLVTLAGLLSLGVFAGWLGAVVGIGGGVVIVPTLVLLFGVDIRVAVAASLVGVVATSTAAGSTYVGEGLANMRLGMTLEVATTLGGVLGGVVAILVPKAVVGGVFAAMMVVTAYLMARKRDASEHAAPSELAPDPALAAGRTGWEDHGALGGAYFDPRRRSLVRYRVERLPLGSAVSFVAGMLSGLLGVGGGFLKVPAMTLGMKVPVKVAAATSNFMIGVTAVSSLLVYFSRGYMHPLIAVPVGLGVTGGALTGAAMAPHFSPRILQRLLVLVLVVVAVQMALDAFGVDLGR